MTRPWQIWIAFALCAVVAIAAMGWLTMHTLAVDRQLSAARAESQLQQLISLVLWRMDTKLAPLIAEEVARPPSFFSIQPVQLGTSPSDESQAGLPRSLPNPRSNVLLNFDVTADGVWNSPQLRLPNARQEAPPQATGETQAEQASRQARLDTLRRQVRVEELVSQLPEQRLPQIAPSAPQLPGQSFYQGNEGVAFEEKIRKKLQNGFTPRNIRYQQAAQQELLKQRKSTSKLNATIDGQATLVENISRPVWVGGNLLLARRVVRDGKTAVQGSWLNWPNLKAELLEEAEDSLPGADLQPVRGVGSGDASRMLAGLPVELIPAPTASTAATSAPIRWALRLGWGALLLAVAAVAMLLWGVLALSERRAAFVSSVTHELRTPLTTFQLYADILARGMVPDAERRQEYLETLSTESQRLSHLVENVLSYARLERGRGPSARERLEVGVLLSRLEPRLARRAAESGMQLHIELPSEVASRSLVTDVGAVEQIVFNLVDNGAKYATGAEDPTIHCQLQTQADRLALTIRDHGPGFDRTRRAIRPRPFSKSSEQAADSAPGVGLGLALCGRLAKQLGGKLEIAHSDAGAAVTLYLPLAK